MDANCKVDFWFQPYKLTCTAAKSGTTLDATKTNTCQVKTAGTSTVISTINLSTADGDKVTGFAYVASGTYDLAVSAQDSVPNTYMGTASSVAVMADKSEEVTVA